jgi:hypothetical protein
LLLSVLPSILPFFLPSTQATVVVVVVVVVVKEDEGRKKNDNFLFDFWWGGRGVGKFCEGHWKEEREGRKKREGRKQGCGGGEKERFATLLK